MRTGGHGPAAIDVGRRVSVGALALLIAAMAMGCGSTVPAIGTPGPTGIVRIRVLPERGPDGRAATSHILSDSEHHVRIMAVDGTAVLDVQVGDDAGTAAMVPVGTAIVSMSTVFFADVLICPSIVAEAPVPTCFRPTLGPGMVCQASIEVRTDSAADVRFTVLADGRCRVEALASPTEASPGPT